MFRDLRKVANFLTTELFEFTFDSQSFLNSALHKFVNLEELRIRSISSAFIRTSLRLFHTLLAVILCTMLALRRSSKDVVAEVTEEFY